MMIQNSVLFSAFGVLNSFALPAEIAVLVEMIKYSKSNLKTPRSLLWEMPQLLQSKSSPPFSCNEFKLGTRLSEVIEEQLILKIWTLLTCSTAKRSHYCADAVILLFRLAFPYSEAELHLTSVTVQGRHQESFTWNPVKKIPGYVKVMAAI